MISELIAVIFTIYLKCDGQSWAHDYDDDEREYNPCLLLVSDLLSKVRLEDLVANLTTKCFDQQDFFSAIVSGKSVME